MTSRQGRPSLYYGWIVMALCMICLMLVVGTTSNAFPLDVLPVSQDYGLSRATTNSGAILMNAGAAVAALFVGRLLDRYSARAIMAAAAVILGACLITFGLSHNIWLGAALLAFPVGFAMSGIGTLTAPALIARWFVVHRGRAMAIAMMGNSLGTIFMVPPLAWLIDRLGWRGSLVTVGCIVTLLVLAMVPFVRNAPGPADREVGEPQAVRDKRAPAVECDAMTSRQLFANTGFWTLGLSTALAMGIFQGFLVTLIPLGRGIGLSNPVAASLLSALGVAAILAKLTIALIGDTFDRSRMLAGAYALMAVSHVTMSLAEDYKAMLASCIVQGIAAGITMPIYLALLADRFGSRNFGTANGNITFLISVLGACAMRFSGEVFDRTGSYHGMFVTFVVLGVVAAILVLVRPRPSRPAILGASIA